MRGLKAAWATDDMDSECLFWFAEKASPRAEERPHPLINSQRHTPGIKANERLKEKSRSFFQGPRPNALSAGMRMCIVTLRILGNLATGNP